jgi:phage repressor protein C with HTH and peptisase S24 domain
MAHVDQRAALARLIEERREDYASLSRLIGRNAAYIQQFIKRGVPRKLDENDRRTLARYFGVPDEMLGGEHSRSEAAGGQLIPIPRLDVGASAGHGSLAEGENAFAHIAFDPTWLRRLCAATPADLSLIRVDGDSMTPTLVDGDEIMVDRSDSLERLRDGIYVLRRDDALMVKRLALSPASSRVMIKSDNPAYPDWPDCDVATLDVIGRVVWAGRKVS